MSDAERKSIGEVVAEAVVTEAAKAIVGPAGVAVVRIGSKLGKEFLGYWQNDDATTRESIARLNAQRDGNLPPFAVVGLGRCGSRVTAKLARMVVDAKPKEEKSQGPITSNTSKLFRLFGGRQGPSILTIEPFMVVGDIDATTFGDVEGILSQDAPGKGVSDRVLRLDYRPLAEGGAGNIPVFGEFLTRALLLVPPTDPDGADHPWKLARTYLIDSCSRSIAPTRLMFYIFSAGGGTGGGSAHEIMRAQRFAISSSSDLDPDTYFTGVTVLPYDGIQNRTRLLNTGRTFVQYLADLNIRLENPRHTNRRSTFNTVWRWNLNTVEEISRHGTAWL